MRGALATDPVEFMGFGIIPADAGSTCGGVCCVCAARDHPRGCGEHGSAYTKGDCTGGSSPRMRGAHYILTR